MTRHGPAAVHWIAMPSYWLTTHWPHPIELDHPWHIYLPDKTPSAIVGLQIAIGDVVVFYETGKGRDEKGQPPLPHGRKGVVAIATVSGGLHPRPVTLHHVDGSS